MENVIRDIEEWYTVSNQDQSYCIDCVDNRAIKVAILTATKQGICVSDLIVSEYQFDRACKDNKSLVDFCNAEVFILDF